MSVMERLKAVFGAKLEKGLDSIEDPREMLDFSLVKLEESLRTTARSALDVGTAKKKLETQRDTLVASQRKYEEQARKAVELGQDDLAREALARGQQAAQQTGALETQIAEMGKNLEAIARSQAELKQKIDAFRLKKEELKASYDASQAQLRVKEALTGVGSEAENAGRIIDRAEKRVAEMRARVAALDDLTAQGIVTDVLADEGDDIDKKLQKVERDSGVEAQLQRLKAELEAKSQKEAD